MVVMKVLQAKIELRKPVCQTDSAARSASYRAGAFQIKVTMPPQFHIQNTTPEPYAAK
ncbi:hypothetical protein RvY_12032 [Ramazzottius varieornatus]|uniref:Uncharacterized protein n=1 Tax=Ramazzottius varieornatus TaxID=947166 RepID=A0A1D1VI37_RAMVA|nr:hypothetical protein RvY_12032 [Ramazzottius varieornatus]